ncbi:threonine synthase [Paramaledivibacter caminithermalis]|jgi:threonine synthase|uniref:Threonine synthase n=1 Tax=Paramaledivibacter caminithermalis (strain DSM 15212 / CIP 107654 / DViRD3) TaxID=1121301 RepID=A0A1M6KQB7_PARC5|nr:threonine synthase [Paramaledivibacter caminithermalis]SHJ61119.1 L-threonine synthase [Paramaledivibacter caminithermalis DSM 15212]
MAACFYKSTRSNDLTITSSEAIVKGLAHDGGLYVPIEFPVVEKSFEELMDMNYRELAFYIMKKYFTDFDDKELLECVNKAYDGKFEAEDIAPLVERKGVYFLELFHGPTLAFKDMALSILSHLLKTASKKLNITREIVILTATSGDTGKAALEGFADVDGIKIIVFFPEDGVSDIQKRQMITQKGKNTFVVGIEGNFDDAQRGVKEVFADKEFNEELDKKGYMFSSANSINIGRLIPQIVYYFSAYLNMLKEEKITKNERINIVVPTGNFGNILAAYYGKKMGLPVNKLICASNENNVLYDFINTGVYDIGREFKKTISPSMDILISSNLERLIYDLSGNDNDLVSDLMAKLKESGVYVISDEMKKGLKDFYGGYIDDDETCDTIKEVYEDSNYVIDTHTAVAYAVYKKYKKDTGDETKTIIASTASPFKFTRSVMKAIDANVEGYDDFKLIKEMSNITDMNIPKGIKDLEKREILHNRQCKNDEIKKVITDILK